MTSIFVEHRIYVIIVKLIKLYNKMVTDFFLQNQ